MLSRNLVRSWMVRKIAVLQNKANECTSFTQNDLLTVALGIKEGANIYLETFSSVRGDCGEERIQAYLGATSNSCLSILNNNTEGDSAHTFYAIGSNEDLSGCRICLIVGALRTNYEGTFGDLARVVIPLYPNPS